MVFWGTPPSPHLWLRGLCITPKPYYYYFPKTFGTNRLMPRFPLLFENNGISIAKQANHDCWIFHSYWCRNVFVYALMPGIKSRFVRHSAKNLEATPWWISSSKISIFYGILLGEDPPNHPHIQKIGGAKLSGSHILLICLICLCKDYSARKTLKVSHCVLPIRAQIKCQTLDSNPRPPWKKWRPWLLKTIVALKWYDYSINSFPRIHFVFRSYWTE